MLPQWHFCAATRQPFYERVIFHLHAKLREAAEQNDSEREANIFRALHILRHLHHGEVPCMTCHSLLWPALTDSITRAAFAGRGISLEGSTQP